MILFLQKKINLQSKKKIALQMKKIIPILISLFTVFSLFSQTTKKKNYSDSLQVGYDLYKKNDTRVRGITERELAKARATNDKYTIASALNLLGLLKLDIDEDEAAFTYFSEALETAISVKDSAIISWSYGNIGLIHYKNRKYYLASKNFLLSQDFTILDFDRVLNYSSLSDVHGALDSGDKAEYYSKQAYLLTKKMNDSVEIGISTILYARSLIRNKKTTTAKVLLDSIKTYIETNKNNYFELGNKSYNFALTEYYITIDSLDKAMYTLNKAATFSEPNFLNFSPSYFYLLKGKIYFKKNDFTKAEIHFKKGFEIDSTNNKNPIDFYPFLSKINEKKGNIKKALAYSNKYNTITDSMYAINNSQKIGNLLYDHERRATEQELLIKNKNIELLQANRKKRNLIYLIVLFSLLISGGIVYYLLKQRLNTKELNLIKAEYNYAKIALITKGEEQEKTKLSKHIHDDITGDLSVIKYTLSTINKEDTLNTVTEKVTTMSTQLDESIDKLRNISHELAPPTLLDFTLIETLQFYCDRLQDKNKNISIQFETVGNKNEPYTNNLATKTTVYRIIQEIISNSIEHAKATQLFLLLSMLNTKLIITIEDNGIGYNTSTEKSGLGIKNIEVRVAMLEGTFEVVSSKEGTKTSIEIPKISL